MPSVINLLPLWAAKNIKRDDHTSVVSTVSGARGWNQQLSPFILGPCKLYSGYVAQNMENGWQFAKVYPEFVRPDGTIEPEYFEWARTGWADRKAHRYPMGKGRKPEFSWWAGVRLTYVEARKMIYVPLYVNAVLKTTAFQTLVTMYRQQKRLVLLDYDAYDHRSENKSLTDVLNDPKKKMGHAFVLMMMLVNDTCLKDCDLDYSTLRVIERMHEESHRKRGRITL